MKKLLFAAMFIVLGAMLYASPIAFGLDSSFNIPYLIANNFKLEINEDMISVTPPVSKIGISDRNIGGFGIFCPEGSDNWVWAVLVFDEKSSYATTYKFVSRNYGEGMSAENTRFFAERYSQEISEEMLLAKMFTGDFSDFFVNMTVASMLNDILGEDTTDDINMWITEDLYIFTVGSSKDTSSIVIFFNTEPIKNVMDLFLEMAFSSMMY